MTARLELALAELAEAIRAEVRAELTPAANAPDRLLNIEQAAAMLGLGRTRLLAEVYSGRLASLRVGRRRLIAARAIAQFIEKSGPR